MVKAFVIEGFFLSVSFYSYFSLMRVPFIKALPK